MKQQNLSVSPNPTIVVSSIPGDLRVAGWDRSEIMAKTDGDELNLAAEGDRVVISCDENLILYLPRTANVTVDRVSGDASLQALGGPLVLGPVAGDLSMNDLAQVSLETVSGDAAFRRVGPLDVQTVSGDFSLRGSSGACSVDTIGGDASLYEVGGAVTFKTVGSDLTLSKVNGDVEASTSVGGDVSLRDVMGGVILKSVGSDIYLRNVRGAVDVSAGSDVTLYVEPLAGLEYRVNAGDDMLVRLPSEASVELHLNGSSPESIQVDFPNVTLAGEETSTTVTLGSGAARMFLTAGGDLLVTSHADKWDSAADFGFGMLDNFEMPEIPGIPPIPPFPPIPPIQSLSPEFQERINRHTREAVERAQARIEAANRRTEARVSAAMRRAEARARAAETRSRSWGKIVVNGRTVMSVGGSGQVPERGEPVSDDERLTILKMLKEKKISLEEAEKLLAALEGK